MNVPTPVLNDVPALTAPVLHGLIALWGLLDCFFGFRIFKVTVNILMAFAGVMLAASLAMQFQPESKPVLIVACLLGLVIGFLLGWFVYKLGVVVMAVFAGFVLTAPFAGLIAPNYALIVQCGAGLLAGVLLFLILEPVIIASTALTGAFRLVFGMAFFMGGPNLLDYMGGTRPAQELLTGTNTWMALLTLLIAVAGFYVQFRAWRGSKRDSEPEA